MSAHSLRLYSKLQQTAHLMKKAADRALLDAAGVTTAQAAVMAVIAAEGAVTQKTAANALSLNESALTAMAARLIALGYVERARNPKDRRAWLLRLTPTGKNAMSRITAPFGAINKMIDETLDEDSVTNLAKSLGLLTKALKQRR